MTQEEAYLRLGLQPLDNFLERRVSENTKSFYRSDFHEPGTANEEDLYRQIGASTWMCARACLYLISGNDCSVESSFPGQTRRLEDQICDFMGHLGHRGVGDPVRHGHYRFEGTPGFLYHRYKIEFTKLRVNELVFNDEDWKNRAIRRSKGPFDMVHIILTKDGHFMGCDEDLEPVLEFSEEGAKEFLALHPEVSMRRNTKIPFTGMRQRNDWIRNGDVGSW
ncbi:MAG: hypothetical protein WC824_09505 [Bacteroidota bacterium]|jgi:hypothetical protein